MSNSYRGRPAGSPVIAGLFAAGVIKRSDTILDVGCGDGIDSIFLKSWGVRRVVGLDLDWENLCSARSTSEASDLKIELHQGSITERHDCFEDGEFSVVIDTLCWNNLADQASPAYCRQVARVLKPGGLFVLQARWEEERGRWKDTVIDRPLPQSFNRLFDMSPLYVTKIPEIPGTKRDKPYAHVSVSVGTKRWRPNRAKPGRRRR